jgi:hypothetical protein
MKAIAAAKTIPPHALERRANCTFMSILLGSNDFYDPPKDRHERPGRQGVC